MPEQITSEGLERCLKCGLVLASRDPAVPPSRDNCRGPDSRGCLRRQLAASERGRWIAERVLRILKVQFDAPGEYPGFLVLKKIWDAERQAEPEYAAEHGGEE